MKASKDYVWLQGHACKLFLLTVFLFFPQTIPAQTCTKFMAPIDPLFQEAFISVAPLPFPTAILYTAKDGKMYTSFAFPGQVIVYTTPETPANDAQALFQSHSGTVLTQLPAAGFYVVQMGIGNEAAFIAALKIDPPAPED